ncbi:hypothetical protein SCLCIDRAFT_1219864 [Scleroderma citrinum Foug A]|uniref:Uncharacterized protein n=1 Tax=Scleroderma citrinum Foug A TaxID=1036808 RepID=A0A0C3DL80_9AGAM|nr:hypothetical protein SCLCIDRAFT_1219864 [Scleroderma citrinum Foug A]
MEASRIYSTTLSTVCSVVPQSLAWPVATAMGLSAQRYSGPKLSFTCGHGANKPIYVVTSN